MYVLSCCNCGITFAIPNDFDNGRRKDHNNFYCPNGHPLSYNKKSEEDILSEKLSKCNMTIRNLSDDQKFLSDSNRSLRGVITKQKKKLKPTKGE